MRLGKTEKRLILCLHDVSPRDFERVREIDKFYADIGVGPNYAMLVVPNFWRRWNLEKHAAFCEWLRERAEAGVEMILHGFYHQDTVPNSRRTLETKIRYSVFGEGEFAALSEEDAGTRLRAGRRTLENILNRSVDSFVAPAWQYSSGSRAALSKLGFRIAEDRRTVWSPERSSVLTKTPVIAYSNRGVLRRTSSLAWSNLATRIMKRSKIVRHALHPADFSNGVLVREIRRALGDLMTDRKIVPYRELLNTAL